MRRLQDGEGAEPLVPLPAIPLLNPPASGWHGLAKVDWVTSWKLKIFLRRLLLCVCGRSHSRAIENEGDNVVLVG